MLVFQTIYGLRLAGNVAIPGLPFLHDSNFFDVRVGLNERGAFPAALLSSGEILPSSPASNYHQLNPRVGMLPDGEYFEFSYSDGARFAVGRRGQEVWAEWPEGYTLEDACTYLVGPVMGFVLRLRGVTCLHASAVALGDNAIALAGSPGAGKSTTAAAFAVSGFSAITDDVVALTEDAQGFMIQPGYPRLNLWPDSARALFGSENALPRITPTWDKRYMALTEHSPGFASKPLPLGAIYVLGAREGALTAPVVEELTGSDAFVALLAHTSVNYLLDQEMRRREFEMLGHLVERIPIRRVRPPTEASAIFKVCEGIASDAGRLTSPVPANVSELS